MNRLHEEEDTPFMSLTIEAFLLTFTTDRPIGLLWHLMSCENVHPAIKEQTPLRVLEGFAEDFADNCAWPHWQIQKEVGDVAGAKSHRNASWDDDEEFYLTFTLPASVWDRTIQQNDMTFFDSERSRRKALIKGIVNAILVNRGFC